MIAHQNLVEMLRREPAVTAPVKRLYLRLPVHRNPLARRFTEPPFQQARFAVFLITMRQRRNVRSPTPKSSAASN